MLQATDHKDLLEGCNQCLAAIWILKKYMSRYKDVETILRKKNTPIKCFYIWM